MKKKQNSYFFLRSSYEKYCCIHLCSNTNCIVLYLYLFQSFYVYYFWRLALIMISRYFQKTSACRLWNPCFTLSDICQPFMIWKAIKYFALLTLLRIFSHDLPNDLILFLHKNRISYNLRCWAMHQMDAVRYWLFLKWTVKVVYPRPSCAHPSWHARHTFWDRVSQIWKIPKERNPSKQQWKDIYFLF